ncbi:hypothetical protein [Nonomuraea rubra]|uniref:hypothetical protein n=1 Tax=Nonomuraea rubra TaxID=46180 RepID=UPI003CD09653
MPDPARERCRERILLEGRPAQPGNPPTGCRFRNQVTQVPHGATPTRSRELCVGVEPRCGPWARQGRGLHYAERTRSRLDLARSRRNFPAMKASRLVVAVAVAVSLLAAGCGGGQGSGPGGQDSAGTERRITGFDLNPQPREKVKDGGTLRCGHQRVPHPVEPQPRRRHTWRWRP